MLSKWRDVQEILREDEVFKWLSKLEALTSWEEWVSETGKKEIAAKAKAKFREERKTRDAFRELLWEHQKAGRIKLTTHWRDIVPLIELEPRYTGLTGQVGSTPHDIFDDFVEELNEMYNDDRAQIKK